MKTHTYQVRLTFVEPLLGTVALDPQVYAEYIGSLSGDTDKLAQEVESATAAAENTETEDDAEEKKMLPTGFHRNDAGQPFLYDYAVKGFFKDAASALNRLLGSLSAKLPAFRKVIDGAVMVLPRRIVIDGLNGDKLEILSRPLRAQTAKGERIALAASEVVPAGSSISFQVVFLGDLKGKSLPSLNELLTEWLDYGQFRGLGQWRNASYGRFSYEIKEMG